MTHPQPWLKSYGGMAAQIDADAHPSALAMMDEAVARYADKAAFRCFGRSLSFAEVSRQATAFAASLQHVAGVKKGDRIAVMLPNLPAFPVVLMGIWRAGGIPVNVNPLYTPRELQHQLQDAGCETMVVFSGSTPTLAEVVAASPVQCIITVGLGDTVGLQLPSPPVDARLGTTVALTDALQMGARLTCQPVVLSGDDVALLQYTGGTTGLSKGATLTHRNLVANILQARAMFGDALRPGEEIIVTAIPMYHIFALTVNFLCYFTHGAENWLVPNARDVESLVDTFAAARPTVFTGVNTLFAGLTLHPRFQQLDFSRLRMAGGGGAAVIEATSDRWREITGRKITEGYGLSETSPLVSFNLQGDPHFSGTTGLPAPSTDVRLLDGEGRDAPMGGSGEVCVKGPQVMRGYWNHPQATAEAFTADGYFRTGDIGEFDDKGQLRIVDRKKDMVIVSGFNVYPNEVEAVATACPGVAECACIGVPDPKTGEAVKLFVVRQLNSALTAEDLQAFCRHLLAAYKVPRHVVFVEALPKSAVGKILRRELRDLH